MWVRRPPEGRQRGNSWVMLGNGGMLVFHLKHGIRASIPSSLRSSSCQNPYYPWDSMAKKVLTAGAKHY